MLTQFYDFLPPIASTFPTFISQSTHLDNLLEFFMIVLHSLHCTFSLTNENLIFCTRKERRTVVDALQKPLQLFFLLNYRCRILS